MSSGLGIAHWLQVETCPDCDDERAPSKHCPECEGTGNVTEERVVNVRIPPGVEDGTRLRVIGEPQDEHLQVWGPRRMEKITAPPSYRVRVHS